MPSTYLSTGSVSNSMSCKLALRTPPQRLSRQGRTGWQPWLTTILLSVSLAVVVVPHASAAEKRDASKPLDWLRFETVLDGRCQNLSEGGKLIVMHNDHPSRTIRYRLLRLYVDRPQGLMDGSILPGEPAQKLGCDRVGGRPQSWQVKRAQFVSE